MFLLNRTYLAQQKAYKDNIHKDYIVFCPWATTCGSFDLVMNKHLLEYQTCNQICINNSDHKVNITLEINNVKNIIDDFLFF